ncbi:protein FAM219A isoform X1 [Nematostella vectensis]|uniref:protein FAM219A isoform X1 n=1 Tax=Nematostella vectensis TaxID=45351 RepID=UPI0020774DEE|nr:protein FAM219A isoform X1 [Nematostella vectensis]
MSAEVPNGSNYMQSKGNSLRKVSENGSENGHQSRNLRSSSTPLQQKLELRLQKSRRKNGNGVITSQPNGFARYKNGSSKKHKLDKRPLFAMDSDSSDEELTVRQYSKQSKQGLTSSQNSKELAECEERLLKDGYRLDEMSDEEDLDLIPPRSVDTKCCGVSINSCVIS